MSLLCLCVFSIKALPLPPIGGGLLTTLFWHCLIWVDVDPGKTLNMCIYTSVYLNTSYDRCLIVDVQMITWHLKIQPCQYSAFVIVRKIFLHRADFCLPWASAPLDPVLPSQAQWQSLTKSRNTEARVATKVLQVSREWTIRKVSCYSRRPQVSALINSMPKHLVLFLDVLCSILFFLLKKNKALSVK